MDEMIRACFRSLAPDDVIIDGGNSNYKDTQRRAQMLEANQIHYVDAGTSGGIWGRENGYSIMVGGDEAVIERLRPIFETLAPAPDKGWGRVGPSGAGHFTKMIHNGIEYGMMQAYGEGFAILNRKKEFKLDLHQIAEIWRDGSVVQSWLLDLTAAALAENPGLEGIAPYVSDSGEGRWTVAEAIDLDVAAPIITLALLQRLQSRDTESFSNKLLSALRNQFGGHEMKKNSFTKQFCSYPGDPFDKSIRSIICTPIGIHQPRRSSGYAGYRPRPSGETNKVGSSLLPRLSLGKMVGYAGLPNLFRTLPVL